LHETEKECAKILYIIGLDGWRTS